MREPSTIKVLIVDDHKVVRDGLRNWFIREDDITVVGEAADGIEALDKVESLSPDIVLTNIKMPGLDGIELCRQVTQKYPSCKVIMLTLYDQYKTQAMEAGASDYLLKDSTREQIIKAIHDVYKGFIPISPYINAPEMLQEGIAKTKTRQPSALAEVVAALLGLIFVTIPSEILNISHFILLPIGWFLSVFTGKPYALRAHFITLKLSPIFLVLVVPAIFYFYVWVPLCWIFFTWMVIYYISRRWTGAVERDRQMEEVLKKIDANERRMKDKR